MIAPSGAFTYTCRHEALMRENRRGEYAQKQVRHYATLTGYTDNIPNFVRYIGATKIVLINLVDMF
jgi:hypothetical protein